MQDTAHGRLWENGSDGQDASNKTPGLESGCGVRDTDTGTGRTMGCDKCFHLHFQLKTMFYLKENVVNICTSKIVIWEIHISGGPRPT